jgi:predicted transcriptional regulator
MTVNVSDEVLKEVKALAAAEKRSDSLMGGILIAQALKERERNRKKGKKRNEETVQA